MVNNSRIKPAREITAGALVCIKKGTLQWEVTVEKLSERRGAAPVAQALYTETPDSTEQRALAQLQQKSWHQSYNPKPTEQEKRQAKRYREKARQGSGHKITSQD